jgi:hypothetical protein
MLSTSSRTMQEVLQKIVEVDDLIFSSRGVSTLYIHPVYKLQCTSIHSVPTVGKAEFKIANFALAGDTLVVLVLERL